MLLRGTQGKKTSGQRRSAVQAGMADAVVETGRIANFEHDA
jgi:hypothetical protein